MTLLNIIELQNIESMTTHPFHNSISSVFVLDPSPKLYDEILITHTKNQARVLNTVREWNEMIGIRSD